MYASCQRAVLDSINMRQTQPVASWGTPMLPSITQTLRVPKALSGLMVSTVGARHLATALTDAFPSLHPPLFCVMTIASSILSVRLTYHSKTLPRLATLFHVGNRPAVSAVDLEEGVKMVITYPEEHWRGLLLPCAFLAVSWHP